MDKRNDPPSPILDVTVQGYAGNSCSARALIDTGADMTVITNSIVKRLNLEPTGPRWQVNGVSGSYESESYYAGIGIDSNFKRLEVLAGDDEFVIIGRDLIRQWWFEIDGCNDTFTIEPCSSSS